MACGAFCVFGPHPGSPLQPVDGPEDPSLLHGVHGTVVAIDRQKPSVIQIVSLPDLCQRLVPLSGRAMTLSGPDNEGRVVYVERESGTQGPRYRLRVVSLLTGIDSVLVERPGSLHPISLVALSPTGGRIAFTSSIDRSNSYDYSPWILELIDISSGQSTRIDGEITQHHPCWFPDSQRLAFAEWQESQRRVSTSILEVSTGIRRVVTQGDRRSLVRGIVTDPSLLLFGEANRLCLADPETGSIVEDNLELPGRMGREDPDPTNSWGIVGDAGGGRVLYHALPTTGADQQLVSGRPYGAKWTIKLCDLHTKSFVTVVPYVWGEVSYGAFDLPPTGR